MKIYLIRHGQSTWNQENRIQGHSDSPLSAEGKKQIERLIPRLKREKIEQVITSPLKRAYQSAQILAEGLGVLCKTNKNLREISLGTWEGKTPQEINQLYNDGYRRWLKCPSKVKIPSAESLSNFRKRAISIFKQIVTSEAAERIALVTHGGILAALAAHWLKADFDHVLLQMLFENSSLTIVEIYDGKVYLTDINDTCHLRGIHYHFEPLI